MTAPLRLCGTVAAHDHHNGVDKTDGMVLNGCMDINANRYAELTPAITSEIDSLINHIAACAGLWSEANVTADIAALRATL
jgi:hypothetical protein